MLFSGCTTAEIPPTFSQGNSTKPTIVTTFYPTYEITKAIIGDTADVKIVIPPRSEPHSFEPTPSQIVALSKSQVFITMGGMFEHIERSLIIANSNIKVVDATHDIKLIRAEEHDDSHDEKEGDDEHEHEEEHSDDEEHQHEHGEYDPHVWLSIKNMEIMAEEIAKQLIKVYPENSQIYSKNLNNYIKNLKKLEEEYNLRLSNCRKNKIIVSHKAFGYLARNYNFEQISIAQMSPDDKPTPKAIKEVIDEAKKHNISYIFRERGEKKISQSIADEIGAEVLDLNPIKLNDDETYFSIMRGNLEQLAKGLECS